MSHALRLFAKYNLDSRGARVHRALKRQLQNDLTVGQAVEGTASAARDAAPGHIFKSIEYASQAWRMPDDSVILRQGTTWIATDEHGIDGYGEEWGIVDGVD